MKRVFLTGGSRGIGAATSVLLHERGWKVIAPTREHLDLQSEESVVRYIHAEMPDDLDALILNAHAWYAQPMTQHTMQDFDRQMAYVRHHWCLLHAALHDRHLTSVVGIASTRGLIGGVDSGPYSMAKAAMIAMMQGFAREYAGVRFNCICPSWTDTDMGVQVKATGGVSNPLAVPQSPAFVAAFLVTLLEDATANGQVWRVADGIAEQVAWRMA
ncbi:MAG TPA: SDR family oxidoreductase [Candidatus Tectomicrobia bacterium]